MSHVPSTSSMDWTEEGLVPSSDNPHMAPEKIAAYFLLFLLFMRPDFAG